MTSMIPDTAHDHTLRMPPCNLTAERSVLGGLMLEIEAIDTIAPLIRPADFYDDTHRILFATMLAMREAGTPVNTISLADELTRLGHLARNEDVLALNDLMTAVPGHGTADIVYDARLVRESAQRRGVIYAARDIESAAYDHADIDDLTARLNRAQQDITGASTMPPPFSLDLITSGQFASENYRQHFSIRRILVAGQPCVLGGPKKVLKTSVLVDLAISLGTGTPFLSHEDFSVADPVNVLMLSGESGGYTLQETARRIALARGRMLSTARIYWGFALPQLGNVMHLAELAKQIRTHDIKVAIIDPAYLCLLSAGANISITSNVFGMGALLKGISEIARDTGCTPIIAHHTRKGDRANLYGVPDLEDLSGSGFAEWARQWILLNRREAYEAGTGEHRLWLNVGGSAGHSGTWALDVNEGTIDEHGSDRTWNVSVMKATEAVLQSRAQKEQAQEHAKQETAERNAERIRDVLRKSSEPLTASKLRSKSGMNSGTFETAFALVQDEITEETVKGGNGRDCTGYTLAKREVGQVGQRSGTSGTVPPGEAGQGHPPFRGVSCPCPTSRVAENQPTRNGVVPLLFENRDR
jgi:hypothetical protein